MNVTAIVDVDGVCKDWGRPSAPPSFYEVQFDDGIGTYDDREVHPVPERSR